MARRMTGRDRLQKLQAEAAATEREREEKRKAKAAKKTTTTRKRKTAASKSRAAAPAARMQAVWAVCGRNGEMVASHPYRDRAAADADAAARSEKSGQAHFVRPERLPMDDGIDD